MQTVRILTLHDTPAQRMSVRHSLQDEEEMHSQIEELAKKGLIPPSELINLFLCSGKARMIVN